jgi:hypothetical protein
MLPLRCRSAACRSGDDRALNLVHALTSATSGAISFSVHAANRHGEGPKVLIVHRAWVGPLYMSDTSHAASRGPRWLRAVIHWRELGP